MGMGGCCKISRAGFGKEAQKIFDFKPFGRLWNMLFFRSDIFGQLERIYFVIYLNRWKKNKTNI